VYVADGGGTNNRIEKFTTNGTFLAQWGTTGAGSNQFNFPARVAVDQTGNFVYVADANNNRIEVFAYEFSPQLISTAGILGQPSFSSSGQFAFEAEGLSGYNYVVQFSTNLVNWTSVETNSAPFIFVNTNSFGLPYTFYRTIFQP
jgi:DNA-binding beta-propeller fold protein YncE